MQSTVVRDLRILMRIILVVIFYWTVGWFVRRRYRRLEREGDQLTVDAQARRGLWEWNRSDDIR